MKYKVRLLEQRMKEVTYLKTIRRYLSDPKMIKDLMDDPTSIMDYSIVNSKKEIVPVSTQKDIINALRAEKLLPDSIVGIIKGIRDDGYSGSTGRLPPAGTVDKAIDIFLSKYSLYSSFLDLFVPESGAGTKSPESISGSYNKNKDDYTLGRTDIFDRA